MYKASIALVCTYDSDADAAYLSLEHPIPPGAAEKVATFDTDRGVFSLDFNADGQILGLELPGARTHLPPALLRAIPDHNPARTTNP